MSINLSGVLLPATTPFNSDETLDAWGLSENLERWSRTGINGFVVLGSTGERVNLNQREYLQAIETARRATPEALTLIVGAGQQSTRETIKEIQQAVTTGAEAVLVITPYFYRSVITQEALIAYYSSVADKSPVPVILYSMPDLTGIRIEPETAAHLSRHQNIIGMKDSSNDVEKFSATVRMVAEDFAMLIGNGTVFGQGLLVGARGGILAVGCAVPQACLEIYRAATGGDRERVVSLQEKLTPLARAVTATYGIGGLKVAMDAAGYVGGSVRAPLRRPAPEACLEIEQLVRARSEPSALLLPLTHA